MHRSGLAKHGVLLLSTASLWGLLGSHHSELEAMPPVVASAPTALRPASGLEGPNATSATVPVHAASPTPLVPSSRQAASHKPTPAVEPQSDALAFDLELDPPEKVLEAISRHPKDLAAARASGSDLLLADGYALKAAGRFADAVTPLQKYHDARGKLASYAALLLGEDLLELKLYDDAVRWLQEAQTAFPSGERQLQARFGLARIELLKGDAGQAAKDLDQLLTDYPRSWRRFQIKLKLAQAFEQNGQLEPAISAYEWLWAWMPATPEAEVAGRELARLQEAHTAGYPGANSAVRYRRALRLLAAGQVEPGLSLMLSLAQDPAVTASLPRSFAFELAKAHFQAKQYTEAAEQLDSWYSRTKGNERAEVLFWRALTQGRLARFDEAIALYRQLAREYPRSPDVETAMYKIGLLRLDQGSYPAAEEAFAAFRERFPRSGQADNAQWYVAWAQLRQGRYAAARLSFEELLRRYPRTSLYPGVRYWEARLAQLQGEKDQAITWYRQAMQSSIPSHYAPLAEMRLKNLGASLEPEPAEQAPEPPPALELPHPEVLERTNALMTLGLRSWAQEELSAYEHGLKSRDELLALAEWYRRTGNYGGARLIVANLGMGEGVPKPRDPGYIWQLSYPLAYRDQLKDLTLPRKVPWELVYAVMRQESEFRPWSTSRAGARGLMQVMPETANEVSQQRKLPLPAVSSLYRPEVCVQYGAWHLEDLMNRLGGRLPLVIAAYNASPEAVERWMKDKPVDPIDVFIEEISYSETRRYVKRVLTNLWVYRRLHGDGKTAFMVDAGMDKPLIASKKKPHGGPPAATPEQAAVATEASEAAE